MRDDFIPDPVVREVHTLDVAADPSEAWAAFRTFDGARVPLVGALWRLRALVDPRDEYKHMRMTVDSIAGPETGFRLLEERPGDALTIGAIGVFWAPRPRFVEFEPEEFADFAHPGYGKLAWELQVTPREGGGSRLRAEVRVGGTDDAACAAFKRYWTVVAPFSHLIRRQLLGGLGRELRHDDDPRHDRTMPGDSLLPARLHVTRSVDVAAPPADVYEQLRVTRWPGPVQTLAARPPQVLVLGSHVDLRDGATLAFDDPSPPRFWKSTLAFALDDLPDGTRLIARLRADFDPDGLQYLVDLGLSPLAKLAAARRLRAIARRAERAAAS